MTISTIRINRIDTCYIIFIKESYGVALSTGPRYVETYKPIANFMYNTCHVLCEAANMNIQVQYKHTIEIQ